MVYNNNKYLILAYTRYDGEVIKSFKKYDMTVFEIHYSEYFIENFQKKYLKSIRNT